MYIHIHSYNATTVPIAYFRTVNCMFCQVVTTSVMPFSMLSSLLAEATMSDIVSAKLCSSMENRFWRVKVSGFISKFLPVSSINFCQCLVIR